MDAWVAVLFARVLSFNYFEYARTINKQSIKSYKRHKYIHVLWFMYYLLSTVVLSQINQQKVKVTVLGTVKVKNGIK